MFIPVVTCHIFYILNIIGHLYIFSNVLINVSASGRSKRKIIDKTGRSSALEKLKEARSGVKRKYEVEELNNVYDEVDDNEYNDTVLKRQRDDWIVEEGTRISHNFTIISMSIILYKLKTTRLENYFWRYICAVYIIYLKNIEVTII